MARQKDIKVGQMQRDSSYLILHTSFLFNLIITENIVKKLPKNVIFV